MQKFVAYLVIAGCSVLGTSSPALSQSVSVIDLGGPFGDFSMAYALNSHEQVVGEGQIKDGLPSSGLLWSDQGRQEVHLPNSALFSPLGINDAGWIVGASSGTDGRTYAAVSYGAQQNTLLPGYGEFSSAVSINSGGQIVGLSYTTAHDPRPVLWSQGKMVDLGTGDGAMGSGAALSINNKNEIVGGSTFGWITHATLWSNGSLQDLGSLSATGESTAIDINNIGQVVGQSSTDDGQTHAFKWQAGQMTDLGLLGGSFSTAYAINDKGVAVGTSTIGSGKGHAVMWDGNAIIDLNDFMDPAALAAGWYLKEARDINEEGWVVGTAQNDADLINGHIYTRAFLMSPVPEASSFATFMLGLGLLGCVTRPRKAEFAPTSS